MSVPTGPPQGLVLCPALLGLGWLDSSTSPLPGNWMPPTKRLALNPRLWRRVGLGRRLFRASIFSPSDQRTVARLPRAVYPCQAQIFSVRERDHCCRDHRDHPARCAGCKQHGTHSLGSLGLVSIVWSHAPKTDSRRARSRNSSDVATCRSDRAELAILGELSPSADMRAGSAFDDIGSTDPSCGSGRPRPRLLARSALEAQPARQNPSLTVNDRLMRTPPKKRV